MDVISINRYYGWYSSPGNLNVISTDLSADFEAWYSLHSKPMLITEYGAGAIAGTHEVRERWREGGCSPSQSLLRQVAPAPLTLLTTYSTHPTYYL